MITLKGEKYQETLSSLAKFNKIKPDCNVFKDLRELIYDKTNFTMVFSK